AFAARTLWYSPAPVNWLKRSAFAIAHRIGFEISKTPAGVLRFDRNVELGRDHLADMRTILGREPRCILDIGANVGQTAAKFAASYPRAEIHSFEPHPTTFETLRRNTAALANVHPVHAAVGASSGEATLFSNVFDQTNSLLPLRPDASEFMLTADYVRPDKTVTVPLTTVDDFCAQNGIDQIDILKTDAEGLDLDVIRGAAGMLARTVVPLIYTEVFFEPAYESQPLFHDLYEHLYKNNYRLVGLYESGHPTHYFHFGANALFVHAAVGRRPERNLRFQFRRYEIYT
nr:FkbM family methyltransferase [Acidobacteriota bacterium]